VDLYTIGFTQKSAQEFFETLKSAGVRRLVDIRLNAQSQLAGFAKQADLAYFLDKLCRIRYVHEPALAPTPALLEGYRQKTIAWPEYEKIFLDLLEERQILRRLKKKAFARPTVLLCSEARPDHCHRRLVAEYLQRHWDDVAVTHLP
jgi:uncharacterized protein (DUF488 family)